MTDISYDRKWHVSSSVRRRHSRLISSKIAIPGNSDLGDASPIDEDAQNTSFEDVVRRLEAKPSVELKLDYEPESEDSVRNLIREWDKFDIIAAVGIIFLFAGFIAALFPDYRKFGVLFPIGAGMIAISGYAARGRDSAIS
jgi:hypothetical protein